MPINHEKAIQDLYDRTMANAEILKNALSLSRQNCDMHEQMKMYTQKFSEMHATIGSTISEYSPPKTSLECEQGYAIFYFNPNRKEATTYEEARETLTVNFDYKLSIISTTNGNAVTFHIVANSTAKFRYGDTIDSSESIKIMYTRNVIQENKSLEIQLEFVRHVWDIMDCLGIDIEKAEEFWNRLFRKMFRTAYDFELFEWIFDDWDFEKEYLELVEGFKQ